LRAGGLKASSETPGIAGVTKVKAVLRQRHLDGQMLKTQIVYGRTTQNQRLASSRRSVPESCFEVKLSMDEG
jgi:hypothetical protein